MFVRCFLVIVFLLLLLFYYKDSDALKEVLIGFTKPGNMFKAFVTIKLH